MYDSDAHKLKDDVVGSGSASLVEVREKRNEVVQVGASVGVFSRVKIRSVAATTAAHIVEFVFLCGVCVHEMRKHAAPRAGRG